MKHKYPLSEREGVHQMNLAQKRGQILGRTLNELERACQHIESLNERAPLDFYQMWVSEARVFIAYARKEGK